MLRVLHSSLSLSPKHLSSILPLSTERPISKFQPQTSTGQHNPPREMLCAPLAMHNTAHRPRFLPTSPPPLEHQQIKMAEHQNIPGSANHRISGIPILYATLSGLAIGVPLLGMMGFTLLASLTLLLVASPLLLLFSPVILPAAFVVAASMAGFSFAAAMAVVGVSTLMLALRYVRRGAPVAISWMMETLTESRQRVKEEWVDHGGCMHHTVEVLPSENENVVNGE